MKKITGFLLLFFSFILLNAQDNYKTGYIITNDDDTVHGLIDFGFDQVNAKRCRFKLAESSEYRDYAPGEIKAYRLPEEGRYYLTLSVPVGEEKNDTVFAEYLVQGKMNLYYYKYNDENEYYYMEKEDGTLHAITRKPDWVGRDSKNYVDVLKRDQKYKGYLTYLLQDAPVLNKEIQNMEFDRRSMIKLSENYHKETCAPGEECIVFENDYTKKNTQFHWSVYGGLGLYKFSNPYVYPNTNSSAPLIGVQMNVSDRRFSKYFSFLLDASFSKTSDDEYNTQYSAYVFGFDTGIRWTVMPEKRFRPSLEMGVGGWFDFNRKYENTASATELPDMKTRVSPFWNIGIRGDYVVDKEKNNSLFFKVEYSNVEYANEMVSNSSGDDKMRIISFQLGCTF